MAQVETAEGFRIVLWITAFAIAAFAILRVTSDQEDDAGDDYAQTPTDIATGPGATPDTAAREYVMPTPLPANSGSNIGQTERAKTRTGIGTITGGVRDEDRVPMAGVEVQLVLVDWEAHEPWPADVLDLSALSDDKGTVEFSGLPLGRYFLKAQADGLHGRGRTNLTQNYLNGRTELRLTKWWILSGRVVDTDGAPIFGAKLFPSMTRQHGRIHPVNFGESFFDGFTTDNKGAFAIARPGPDLDYKLLVKAEGYATYASEFIGPNSGTVEFVLDQGVQFRGHFVHADSGEPVAEIAVSLNAEMVSDRMDARANAEGAFEFPMVRPGVYDVSLAESDWVIANHPLRLVIDSGAEAESRIIEVATGGTLLGRVYEESTGRGVGEMRVSARSEEFSLGRKVEARTDSDGNYRLTGLPKGAYTLRRDITDEYPWNLGSEHNAGSINAAATLNQESTGHDFVLKTGLRIHGRVVDIDGEPIEGALVRAENRRYSGDHRVTTDSGGAFRLAGLVPHNRYEVAVWKDGYARVRDLDIPISNDDIVGQVIVMQPEASVSGVVVDPFGNGVPAASIRLDPPSPTDYGSSAETDRTGAFKVSQLGAGVYRVELKSSIWSDNSYDPDVEVELKAGEQLKGLRLVYDKETGLTIEGRVTDTRRQPLEDASIYAFTDEGVSTETKTDSSGNYRLTGPEDNDFSLNVNHAGFSGQDARGVQPGSKNIDFQLVGTGTIKGFVVDASTGEPVTTFRITHGKPPFRPHRFADRRHNPWSDLEGRFEIANVGEGEVIISVRADGFAPTIEVVQGVTEHAEITGIRIALQPGAEVLGHVNDSQGNPVMGATATLVPEENRRDEQETHTDAEGAFQIDGLGPGLFRLTVQHEDFASASQSLTLFASGRSEVTFTLESGATLDGRVTVGGQPLPSARVSLRYPEIREAGVARAFSGGATTDEEGYYRITHLTAGTAHVSVSSRVEIRRERRTLSTNTRIAVPNGGTIQTDFNLSADSATIAGTVYGEGDMPVQASVRARVQGVNESASASVTSDANGQYLLEGLIGGTATIDVYAEGHPSRRFNITLAEDTATSFDIRLDGGGSLNVLLPNLSSELARVKVQVFQGSLVLPALSNNWLNRFNSLRLYNQNVQGESISIPGLEPGEYTVVATASENRDWRYDGDYLANLRIASAFVTIQSEGEEVGVTLVFSDSR